MHSESVNYYKHILHHILNLVIYRLVSVGVGVTAS